MKYNNGAYITVAFLLRKANFLGESFTERINFVVYHSLTVSILFLKQTLKIYLWGDICSKFYDNSSLLLNYNSAIVFKNRNDI